MISFLLACGLVSLLGHVAPTEHVAAHSPSISATRVMQSAQRKGSAAAATLRITAKVADSITASR
ncbi:hypothetical protein ACFST9_16805 [Hymenobacter monticola]|uniref:Secreted protein n=1 Tax=Hymenobacter monticola TaxID=1705399 RepID=A0ABY4B243_9BACT|nr:hypothetical protein [Hymenobacter monticola]UOE32432.1 hypothetical protein MTP16_14975 [Hymenobacter monticola]